MNILFLSDHCCIRGVKEGLALASAGHSILYMCRRVANTDMEPALSATTRWRNTDDLEAKLSGAGAFDVIHVHNEPSGLVSIARRCCPGATIILDCHDLDACRGDTIHIGESLAFADCDGLIFPSKAYEQRAMAWFKIDRPTAVVPSQLTAEMIAQIQEARPLGGIVYQGATSRTAQPYLDYRPIANHCHEIGVAFTVIQASNEAPLDLVECGAHVLGPIPYMAMLSELTRYDYGWCGPGDGNHPQWQRTVPNKLWEYIAAGLPVLALAQTESGRIVSELGVGETVETFEEIDAQRWGQLLSRRRHYVDNCHRYADALAMDNHVNSIIDLYGRAQARRAVTLPAVRPYRPKPQLSYVAGTLNRINSLIAMVQSCRVCTSIPYEIVIVDGGSTDGTERWCREQPDVVFIQQGERRGAVAAYNAAFEAACGDIIVQLNDDAQIYGNPNSLPRIFNDSPNLAQLCFEWADPGQPYAISRTPPVGLHNAAIPYANFGAVRYEMGRAVGWWGDVYHHHAGDCELTLRLMLAGWDVGNTNACRVDHERKADETRKMENTDLNRFKLRWLTEDIGGDK
jgi:hypothetical protein